MLQVLGVLILMAGILVAAALPPSFNTVVNLESTSEESANRAGKVRAPNVLYLSGK